MQTQFPKVELPQIPQRVYRIDVYKRQVPQALAKDS